MFYGDLAFVVMPLAVLGVVVLGILALAGGRAEPDVRGERAHVLYVSLVSFIAMFTLLFALTQIAEWAADSIVDAAPDCSDPSTFAPECYAGVGESVNLGPGVDGDGRARDAINGGAVAVVAALVLLLHRRKTKALTAEGTAPALRTHTAYLYATSFAAMIVLLVTGAMALYAAVTAVAPGTVSSGPTGPVRDNAIVDLVPALTAAGGAALIYVTHWRVAERLRRG